MQSIDAVDTKQLTQKCEFFTKLAQAIPQFPRVGRFFIPMHIIFKYLGACNLKIRPYLGFVL